GVGLDRELEPGLLRALLRVRVEDLVRGRDIRLESPEAQLARRRRRLGHRQQRSGQRDQSGELLGQRPHELLLYPEARLGRRGPSPATACSAHYIERRASAGGAPARRPAARTL